MHRVKGHVVRDKLRCVANRLPSILVSASSQFLNLFCVGVQSRVGNSFGLKGKPDLHQVFHVSPFRCHAPTPILSR